MPGMCQLQIDLRGDGRILALLKIEQALASRSQEEAAELLGVSHRTLKRILAEERRKRGEEDVKRHAKYHVERAARARRKAP